MKKKTKLAPRKIRDFIPKDATFGQRFGDNFFCERRHLVNPTFAYCGREAVLVMGRKGENYNIRRTGYFCREHLNEVELFYKENPDTEIRLRVGVDLEDWVDGTAEYFTIWTAKAVKDEGR